MLNLTAEDCCGGCQEEGAPQQRPSILIPNAGRSSNRLKTEASVPTANQELAHLYDQIAQLMTQAEDELRPSSSLDTSVVDSQIPIKPEDMLARVGRLIANFKHLNDRLRRAQKMEAVGRLAGGNHSSRHARRESERRVLGR